MVSTRSTREEPMWTMAFHFPRNCCATWQRVTLSQHAVDITTRGQRSIKSKIRKSYATPRPLRGNGEKQDVTQLPPKYTPPSPHVLFIVHQDMLHVGCESPSCPNTLWRIMKRLLLLRLRTHTPRQRARMCRKIRAAAFTSCHSHNFPLT